MSGIDSLKKGLAILEKYEVKDMCAEHDVIYFVTKSELSEEDRKVLTNEPWDESLSGWHWDEGIDSWGFFT